MGADGSHLSPAEAGKLSDVTTHLSLTGELHSLRQDKRDRSLMDWLIGSIRDTCQSTVEVPIDSSGCRTTEGQALPRELDIRDRKGQSSSEM